MFKSVLPIFALFYKSVTDGPSDQRTNGPTDGRTDRRTDGPTNRVTYKVACMRLKRKRRERMETA